MELYILDSEFNAAGVIDSSDAESILWNKKYNDTGYCEIYIMCTEHYIELLKKGNYIFRFDDDMFCKIDKIEITTDVEEGDYIIATATDICGILSGRIIRDQIAYGGTFPGFIKKLLQDNVISPAQSVRKINNFEIYESNFSEFSETIDISVANEDLLQTIIDNCKSYGYGFRVYFDYENSKLVFKLYKGKNRAAADGDYYVEFSPEYGNIISSDYKDDESSYKNIVYVGYVNGQGKNALLSMHNETREPSGILRREIYVDGTNTSRSISRDEITEMFPSIMWDTVNKNGYIIVDGQEVTVVTYTTSEYGNEYTVSDYTYLMLIRAIGQNALSGRGIIHSFSGDVDIEGYVYKSDYDLGDIVHVENDYGISAMAQIAEILECEDNDDGYTLEPHFEYLSEED